jgi:hypothetical protein
MSSNRERRYHGGPRDGTPLDGDADFWTSVGFLRPSVELFVDRTDCRTTHRYVDGWYAGPESTADGLPLRLTFTELDGLRPEEGSEHPA